MSTKYGRPEDVPTSVLAKRLDELSLSVAERGDKMDSDFTMRIPAEVDRDADIVLYESAKRLRQLDACRPYLKEGETVADALKRLSERKTVRSLCEAYEACKPFLKDGEAPAECLARNRADIARLMGKWGAEKMTSARLRTALDKIAQTTGSDDPCRPLVQIARDALKRLTKELDAVRSELANAEDERNGQ